MGTIWKIDREGFVTACNAQPKYKALALMIEQAITCGELAHQQKLPAQRILADELTITHGTVTRAYELVEKRGFVKARLGAGTFVNAGLLGNKPTEGTTASKVYDFASSMQPMLGQQNILAQAMQTLAEEPEKLAATICYSIDGIARHKQVVSDWLQAKGIENKATDIVFTQGAQQGIYTCLQILTQPGEYVLHEALTYPGFYRAAEASRLNMLALPTSEQGLDLACLEAYCQQYNPKVLYITPNCQNPTNIQYCQEQRQKILALSRKYLFYIIEDDVNYCLPEHWRTPLQQEAPEQVFYLSSLSKYFAGGLRFGYVLVPSKWQQSFNMHLHSQCWMSSALNIDLVSRFIGSEIFIHNQQRLADEMRYRQQVFKCIFEKHGIAARLGGLNIWVTLPNDINMHQFNGHLFANNVKVRTADLFRHRTSNLVAENALRLSLGSSNIRADFEHGVLAFERLLIEFKSRQDVVI